ncbi:ParB/RepB/Spo0J family partition protein [Taylorella equigenitalis]|uniref:ParB/RepB/Spo0J family partition protein n=1 Tax=Taylorella equigenitalis TaxID=29575 RepID=UPI0023B0DC06|nr:ParB/RepB/Spo0J family partition protein [Taylorella equigenitalis]WEE00421.1 ParB/RepB/Spo0J family partition protein [Taylorella equigenitalis]WEE01897.1 ParB/RepB/Spo0J family partition protein [Taylorella equigenitalis]WFD78434.1 ParB/RepB/Spo0J family partition protein [Taylorella equigenitalis]WFD79912.1 ParB/RepB/Spo0J family partition protein [Taylorella equigenitalis]WFD81388.1 ParB/RepB/Spo0J family partition protein [Taylorella equigenitalis]
MATRSNKKNTITKSNKTPKRGLGGLGLSNLLGHDSDVLEVIKNPDPANVINISLKKLQAGKYQPRKIMDEENLEELANSIKDQGVMIPILVRPLAKDKYEIIAGERRFRAASMAGLTEIPALIKDVNDEQASIMALIENMQREDLKPLEEAKGIRKLIDDFKFTHEQAAKAVGRSRSFTTNLLRLLNLAPIVQKQLDDGKIDMGHARALLSLDSAQQILVANQVESKGMSVRDTEKLVSRYLEGSRASTKSNKNKKSTDVIRLENKLSDHFNTTISIKMNTKEKGQLVINFHSWDQLNEILEKQGVMEILD